MPLKRTETKIGTATIARTMTTTKVGLIVGAVSLAAAGGVFWWQYCASNPKYCTAQQQFIAVEGSDDRRGSDDQRGSDDERGDDAAKPGYPLLKEWSKEKESSLSPKGGTSQQRKK